MFHFHSLIARPVYQILSLRQRDPWNCLFVTIFFFSLIFFHWKFICILRIRIISNLRRNSALRCKKPDDIFQTLWGHHPARWCEARSRSQWTVEAWAATKTVCCQFASTFSQRTLARDRTFGKLHFEKKIRKLPEAQKMNAFFLLVALATVGKFWIYLEYILYF